MKKLLIILTEVLILSGCNWTSHINSKMGLLSITENQINITIQNKLNEPVPYSITGGSPPYTVEIVSGIGQVDNITGTITTHVPGPMSVRILDSSGLEKIVQINFSSNQSVHTGTVTNFILSSDFSKVYFLQTNGSGFFEMLKVNSDGSGLQQIISSGTVVGSYTIQSLANGALLAHGLTPNQNKLVFAASDTTGITRLYSSNVDGTAILQLSADYINPLQRVKSFSVLSDTKVIYSDGEQEDSADVEPWMRVVNIDGTGRQLVHPPMGSNGDGQQVLFSTLSVDKSKLFYFTEIGGNIFTGLYITNADGSSAGGWQRISPNGVDFWSGQTSSIAYSADLSTAFATNMANSYLCRTDLSGCQTYAGLILSNVSFTIDGQYALANVFGVTQYLLNSSMVQSVNFGSGFNTYKFITGSNYVYKSDLFSSGNIYRTPLTTAAPPTWVQLSPAFNGFSIVSSFSVSADNQKIFFVVDDQSDAMFRIYRMNLDGSGATPLANVEFDQRATPATIPVIKAISQNQERMLIQLGNDLFMVDLVTESKVKLTDRIQTGSTISSVTIQDDVQKIYYKSNQNNLGLNELFQILSPF